MRKFKPIEDFIKKVENAKHVKEIDVAYGKVFFKSINFGDQVIIVECPEDNPLKVYVCHKYNCDGVRLSGVLANRFNVTIYSVLNLYEEIYGNSALVEKYRAYISSLDNKYKKEKIIEQLKIEAVQVGYKLVKDCKNK
jgi:hypothetical protein